MGGGGEGREEAFLYVYVCGGFNHPCPVRSSDDCLSLWPPTDWECSRGHTAAGLATLDWLVNIITSPSHGLLYYGAECGTGIVCRCV